MKRISKICLLAAFVLTAGFVNAQTLKFGHIDTQALLQVMPERAAAESTLQKVAKDLEEQQTTIQSEYKVKLDNYLARKDSLSDVALTNLEKELQDIQQRAESFRQVAMQQYQAKQGDLMKPIVAKINSTIEAVAKEQGLIYVFDTQVGGPVLYKSNLSTDILPLCKVKLGIK